MHDKLEKNNEMTNTQPIKTKWNKHEIDINSFMEYIRSYFSFLGGIKPLMYSREREIAAQHHPTMPPGIGKPARLMAAHNTSGSVSSPWP